MYIMIFDNHQYTDMNIILEYTIHDELVHPIRLILGWSSECLEIDRSFKGIHGRNDAVKSWCRSQLVEMVGVMVGSWLVEDG